MVAGHTQLIRRGLGIQVYARWAMVSEVGVAVLVVH